MKKTATQKEMIKGVKILAYFILLLTISVSALLIYVFKNFTY